VPLMYPKVRAEFGDEVLYAQSPARHLMVEFAFDVSQVARGGYALQAYRDIIGFEVAEDALARAIRQTYGFDVGTLFTDLSIGTFRYAVSRTIPEMTRLAWRDKQDEILAHTPNVREGDFVLSIPPREYEKAYGAKYRKPGVLARVLAEIFKVLPKVGPLRPLAFEPLTPEAERLFLESFTAARERYRTLVGSLRAGTLRLGELDLDTGHAPRHGANPLAEETFVQLLEELQEMHFADVPPALQQEINHHYQGRESNAHIDRKTRKREEKARELLTALNCARDQSRSCSPAN
jgi:hypothetical protein